MGVRDAMSGAAWGVRRWVVIAGAAALVVIVVVAVLTLGGRGQEGATAPDGPGGSDDGPGVADEPFATAQAGDGERAADGNGDDGGVPSDGSPGDPVVPQDQLDPALPPVPLRSPAPFGDGVTAVLADVEAVGIEAQGPGEVAGPGLRLAVRVENGTDEAVLADRVVVNVYAGEDLVPCEPMVDGARELTGPVSPGEATDGVYVFAVPADLRDHLRVTVTYDPAVPMVVFEGAAPAA